MKNISIMYENAQTVDRLIAKGDLSPDQPYFIRVATASEEPEAAVQIARTLQARFQGATIVGFSTCGLIHKGNQHTEGTLVLFQLFEKTDVFVACFTFEGKSAITVADEVASAIAGKNARLVHVLCGNNYYDVHDFIEEFNNRNNKAALVGGVAGNVLTGNIEGFVFTPRGVVKNGIVIAALCGSEFSWYTGVNTAHEPVSVKHKLTGSEGTVWKEVDGQDIEEWLFEQLGIEKKETYSNWDEVCANDVLVRFPMILENRKGVSRFLRYNAAYGGFTQYDSQIPEGTEFRIGYVSPSECVEESFRLCGEIMNQRIEELFVYTCLFRRLFLQNCSNWELRPYRDTGICGAFMMGEISNVNGRNEFLNGTCCIVGIAESETYIRPDISVFDELGTIEDDTKELLNDVLKRQQKATTRQNDYLLQTLLSQQQTQQEQMYIDTSTGMANYLKYKEDKKTRQFNKLCMVKIENAELLVAHKGHSAYIEMVKKTVEHMRGFMKEQYSQEQMVLESYAFNESHFFIVADERLSEDHFIKICESLHKNYHFYSLGEDMLVSRFVVSLNPKTPLDNALNSLAADKHAQKTFWICKDEGGDVSSAEEFKMIGVLNRAIENDGVVPHFQGIYDNKRKEITRYESLMRIVDVDGTMYSPAQFMDIAKRYHMYTLISRKMIEKVFWLFAKREECVSINVSVLDINDDETQQLIFDELRSCKNPENFVFEILEDEAHREFATLKAFISSVKELAGKVAIDDFGSGYSNFSEVSNISFDIIKVDGSIVSNLQNDESYRRLLDIITHMGRLFQVEVIAEFVKNQEIQDIVVAAGIDYSQGYLFAKPMPYMELGLPG